MCAARDPMAGLRGELVRLRKEVGEPSYRRLEADAALLRLRLPTSTVSDLLTDQRLARWDTVWGFVQACRKYARDTGLRVPADRFDQDWWRGQYPGNADEPARAVDRVVLPGYYSSVIDAFRADHADADWGDIVDELLTAFAAEPGFHVVTGEAYAGKTALMTKLHEELERRDVPVVIFYVVQHEEDRPVHYLPAVITQLLAVLAAREDRYASMPLEQTVERQLVQYEELWRAYSAVPEPVFLLLDGLDERAPEPAGVGLPALVPRSAGTHGRVVLTTRSHPALDLPRAHPLNRSLDAATHVLTPSPRARAERGLVERELAAFLRGEDARGRDLAGLVAVAGGPVSDREVAELLTLPTSGAAAALRAPIARSLFLERASDGTPRFRFAHRAIRAFVEEELDRDGAGGTDAAIARVLAWADRYATQGWPRNTPRFLAEHLPTFIASRVAPQRRGPRLAALLHDDYRRLTRMVSSTDRAFLQLIELARETVAADTDVGTNPVDAFLVEAWSAEIAAFNPTAWYSLAALVRAGLHDHALAEARLIPDSMERGYVMIALVTALHQQGAWEALRSAQREMATAVSELDLDIDRHHDLLGLLVRAALLVGDPAAVWSALDAAGHAHRRSVAELSTFDVRGPVSTDLAVEFSRSELGLVVATAFLREQALLHQAAGSPEQEMAALLSALPDGAAAVETQLHARTDTAAGAPIEACLSLFAKLTPTERAFELGAFAGFLTDLDTDRALVVARAAHAEAAALPPHDQPRWEFAAITGLVYARAGLHDDAAEVARELAMSRNPDARSLADRVYDEIACSLTRLGRLDEARDLLDGATPHRAVHLAAVVRTAAEMGELPAALAIVDEMRPGDRGQAYAEVVDGLCRAGDYERAQDLALRVALETPAESDPVWRGGVYGRLCKALTAIGRRDLARQAADHVPAAQDHHGVLVAQIDATAEKAADDMLVVAWAGARAGALDTCTAITRAAGASPLRSRLSAVEAFCLHRLGRSGEACVRLDAIVTESRQDAAAAALMMAEASRTEPDETAYRTCAVHLAQALLRNRESLTRRRSNDAVVLAHSSLVLAGDIGPALAEVASKDNVPLLGLVLRRVCRSLAAARPDDPQLSSLVAVAMAHLPDYQSPSERFYSGDSHLAALAEIMARAGRMEDALRLATAVGRADRRARALSPALPLLPGARRYDGLWRLAERFDDPLNRVLLVARTVATVLDPSEQTYRRSVRRLFDEARAITDVHERWEALGYLALALLPVSPECLDHYLSRQVSRISSMRNP